MRNDGDDITVHECRIIKVILYFDSQLSVHASPQSDECYFELWRKVFLEPFSLALIIAGTRQLLIATFLVEANELGDRRVLFCGGAQ